MKMDKIRAFRAALNQNVKRMSTTIIYIIFNGKRV